MDPQSNKVDKFTFLYKKYNQDLLRYAKDILKSKELAEEALQETYACIFKNLNKITELTGKRTRNYLITIVKNVCFTMLKKEEQERTYNFELIENIHVVDEDPTWETYKLNIATEKLLKLVQQLDEIDQTILIYKVLKQWSYKDISNMLNISEKNVSVRLSRARSKLKEAFYRENKHEDDKV